MSSLFLIGCNDKFTNSRSDELETTETKKPKAKKIKVLFDAEELLGKQSSEIDKVFGKPYLITGESKSNPTRKSRWHWYKYKKFPEIKEISVFIDKDEKNNIADSFTILFNSATSNAKDTASKFAIDLSNIKPVTSKSYAKAKDERYEINSKGKILVFYYFKNLANSSSVDDTVRIFYDQ